MRPNTMLFLGSGPHPGEAEPHLGVAAELRWKLSPAVEDGCHRAHGSPGVALCAPCKGQQSQLERLHENLTEVQ